jgi:acetyl esterase
MKSTMLLTTLALGLTLALPGHAAEAKKAYSPATTIKEFSYKKIPEGELKLSVNYPKDWKAADQRPAIVFFFGGGWKNGTIAQFESQADYLATRGLVAVRADYRVSSRQKVTPDQCVEDAKSAIRWVRAHAKELGVDANRIVGAGGSAGGHIAACAFMTEGLEAAGEDLKVSSKPNLLVLFNPALDLVKLGVKVTNADGKTVTEQISPNGLVKKGVPPVVMFFGTEDKMVEHAREFVAKSKAVGNHAELYTAAGSAHGFFNRSPWTEVTIKQADEFLIAQGYLKGKPTMVVPDGGKELKREGE